MIEDMLDAVSARLPTFAPKRILSGIAMVAFAWTTPLQAVASVESAEDIVIEVHEALLELLEEIPPSSEIESRKDEEFLVAFETLITDYFNVPAIAQAVLGPAWRRATEEQRQAFVEVFSRYLAEKYSPRFTSFAGLEFEVLGSSELRENHFEVRVDLSQMRVLPSLVRWFVLSDGEQSRIVNLSVGDINVLGLERRVIKSLLSQRGGDLDKLIAYLPLRYNSN